MIFSIKIIFFLVERNWDTLGLNFKQFEVTICLILNDFWCCCSVAKLYLTLCNPMSFMPGFPLLHHRLLEFPQIQVHWFGVTIYTISSSAAPFFGLQSFPESRSFPMSWWPRYWSFRFSIVIPTNIQHWFSSGLTGLISWLSKGLSRVFSSITIQRHQLFGAQPSLRSNSHICTWLVKKS